MWLRLVRADVARRPASIALNGALLALAAAVLAAFALVLPTYRASFTAAVESAAFDVDLAACGCTSADIARLRSLSGVDRVLPVLGIGGLSVRAGARSGGAWGWAIGAPADGDLLPVGPRALLKGSFDLGSVAAPQAVIDLDLARSLDVGIGDAIETDFSGQPIRLEVAGITGPAGRFRGPTMVFLRALVEPLIPATSEITDAPYTEVFIAGPVAPDAVRALFPPGTTAVYTKAEQLHAQESQIELDSPVISIVSLIAALALLAVLVFMGAQAIERRTILLGLLPHFGRGRLTGLAASLLLDGGLNAVAATAGTALGIGMIVNGYFGGIGAFVTGGALVGLALSVGLASLLAHTVAFAALAPRLARR